MSDWVEVCAKNDINWEDVIRLDYTTGVAEGAPVCVNLKTYSIKIEDCKVFIAIV